MLLNIILKVKVLKNRGMKSWSSVDGVSRSYIQDPWSVKEGSPYSFLSGLEVHASLKRYRHIMNGERPVGTRKGRLLRHHCATAVGLTWPGKALECKWLAMWLQLWLP